MNTDELERSNLLYYSGNYIFTLSQLICLMIHRGELFIATLHEIQMSVRISD